jgi:hypothetical protein
MTDGPLELDGTLSRIEWSSSDDDAELSTGTIAEDLFRLWCSQGGLVATSVQRDVYGWDFLVEYGGKSEHWRVDHTTCKVQVKGTRSATSVRIKLDNIVRMANEPVPWFVAIVQVDDRGMFASAHLVHFDEDLISRAYERVKALPEGAPLHHREMTLSWGSTDAVDSPRALAERIRQHVGPSPWDYVETKRKWQPGAALARFVRGTASILAPTQEEAWDLLADLAIGLIDRVPLRSVSMTSLAIPPDAEFVEGYIQIEGRSSLGPSTIRIQSGSLSVTLKCATYTSALFPGLPVAKICFDSSWLKCIVADGSKVHWHLPPRSAPLSVAEIGTVAKAMLLIQSPDTKYVFDVEGTMLTISRREDDNGVSWERDALDFALAGNDACWIAGVLGLDLNTPIDPRTLPFQRRQLAVMRGFLDRSASIPSARLEATDATADVNGKRGGLVVCPLVFLGDLIVACSAAAVGTFSRLEGESHLSVLSPTARVFETRVIERANWTSPIVKEMVEAACSRLDAEGLLVALSG